MSLLTEIKPNAVATNKPKKLTGKQERHIDARLVKSIVNCKLLKTAELEIQAGLLDEKSLHNALLNVISQSQLLDSIYNQYHRQHKLEDYCKVACKYPLLLEKLTALSVRLPEQFHKSLSTAFLSLFIGGNLDFDQRALGCLFLSGLWQDIGMLHISVDVSEKQRNISGAEWKVMQSHVLITEKIMQHEIYCPLKVKQAVLEHHERCDGSGYPHGKVESELGISGQITSVANTLAAIWQNKILPEKYRVRDMLPILQMNSHVYRYDVYSAVIKLIKSINTSEDQSGQGVDIVEVKKSTIKLSQDLNHWFELLCSNITEINQTVEHKLVNNMQNIKLRMSATINESGVFDVKYFDKRDDHRKQFLSSTNQQMLDTYLMLQELSWQLERLTKMINIFIIRESTLGNSKIKLEKIVKNMALMSAYRY